MKTWRYSDSQQNVQGSCRCSRGRRDKRTQKTVERRIQEELRDQVKAEVVDRRVMEYRITQPTGTQRTKSSPDEGQTDAPTRTRTSSSSSGSISNAALASSSNSSDDAARAGSSGEDNGSRTVDNKRKADGEHPEDPPERQDGKWMRIVGSKRYTVEKEKESMLRKTVKYF